jgi:N-acyl-D-aspartate/D-glutamate deacylase
MDYDLLVRGGRVVDGSGLPGYIADVGARDGKVVAIGRLKGSAARTIDATGAVVAPGFIDSHTHLDAQVLWDPYGTSAPQHGVTSVVMDNCGLTLAPTEDDGHDAIVQSFVRVEAIPRAALEAGVPWGWRSFGEYLDRLEGRVGINVSGLVGHIAVRQCVMGEDAVERGATPDEVARMQDLVRESLKGGALGLSTNRNHRHMREDGKPVASRLADDAELFALCDVLSDLNSGVVQTTLGLSKPGDAAWYEQLARRSGRPVLWQQVQLPKLRTMEPIFRAGYQAYGQVNTRPLTRKFTLKDVQLFDEFPTWKQVMFLPEAARKQAFADPETQRKLREDFATPQPTTFHRRWDIVQVLRCARPENAPLQRKSVAAVAMQRGQDPVDALIDLSLEEDLATTFESISTGGINTAGDPEAMGEILRSPYVLPGVSDAGAHVQFGADFGYSTTLLGLWVRERRVVSLEHAIHLLTFRVASVFGMEDRGLLRPGYAADLCVFDPTTVDGCEPEWAQDYPAGTRRLMQPSVGVHYTIVNGRVIYEDGRLTGDLPGTVLRGAAHARRSERIVTA